MRIICKVWHKLLAYANKNNIFGNEISTFATINWSHKMLADDCGRFIDEFEKFSLHNFFTLCRCVFRTYAGGAFFISSFMRKICEFNPCGFNPHMRPFYFQYAYMGPSKFYNICGNSNQYTTYITQRRKSCVQA